MTNEFRGAGLITRATIVSVDDAGDHQRLVARGYAGEQYSEVVRAQSHGLSSNPPPGAVGTLLRMGESDRVVALGFEMPGRIKNLKSGGTAVSDSTGRALAFNPGEPVTLDGKGGEVKVLNASKVTVSSTAEILLEAGGRFIRIRPGRVDIGIASAGEDAPARMMTEAGPSNIVWARVS